VLSDQDEVISPAGRAFYYFWSTPELLKVLHDANRAHKSLFIKGEVLHGNVLENKIIIVEKKEAYVLDALRAKSSD